jgi:hypothetical protein
MGDVTYEANRLTSETYKLSILPRRALLVRHDSDRTEAAMVSEKIRLTMRCDPRLKSRLVVAEQQGGRAGGRAATSDPVALRPDEAAAMIGVAPKTLANWRWLGRGPDYLKLGATGGAGAVRYDRTALLQWLAARTSCPGVGAGKEAAPW